MVGGAIGGYCTGQLVVCITQSVPQCLREVCVVCVCVCVCVCGVCVCVCVGGGGGGRDQMSTY